MYLTGVIKGNFRVVVKWLRLLKSRDCCDLKGSFIMMDYIFGRVLWGSDYFVGGCR